VIAFLQDVFRQQTLAEAVAWLSDLDLCFGPVHTLPEAFEDANVAARGMVLTDERGRRHIGPVIRFTEEPARPTLVEPALGAHTEEVLGRIRRGAKRQP
jgi:crotonobetainyl-CoA:carnitine CoA-transferase CaiB-like acyl-CoA transferase